MCAKGVRLVLHDPKLLLTTVGDWFDLDGVDAWRCALRRRQHSVRCHGGQHPRFITTAD